MRKLLAWQWKKICLQYWLISWQILSSVTYEELVSKPDTHELFGQSMYSVPFVKTKVNKFLIIWIDNACPDETIHTFVSLVWSQKMGFYRTCL